MDIYNQFTIRSWPSSINETDDDGEGTNVPVIVLPPRDWAKVRLTARQMTASLKTTTLRARSETASRGAPPYHWQGSYWRPNTLLGGLGTDMGVLHALGEARSLVLKFEAEDVAETARSTVE